MEGLGRAQACEAAGDHDGALEWVKTWAEAVHGPGTAGLQQLRIVSLKRLNRHDEAEAAIARLRWVPFIGQFWPLTSLNPGGKNRVRSQCRPDGEFCLPRSCEALHGSTST